MMENEYTSRTGTCRFCGQTMMIEMPEDEWRDKLQKNPLRTQDGIAEDEATLRCTCIKGRSFRKRSEAIRMCADNIEAMFRNKYPEVADLLQEAKGIVYGGTPVRKVTVTLPEGAGVASISFGKTGLKIEHRKLLHSELSTGLE